MARSTRAQDDAQDVREEPPRAAPTWHALGVEETLARLATVLDGLEHEEASARLARVGPNALREARPVRPWRILVGQFRGVLVGLLVAAALVSWLLGEWVDALAILAILVLNGLIGFHQEYGAERSLAALRGMTSPRARVRRGGAPVEIPASEVVPGDVLLLEAGDVVQADVRLVEAVALRCSEAALTGESEPVTKAPETLEAELALGDRANMAFMGTSVAAGTGVGVVVATGMGTEIGRIAELLATAAAEEEETPLQLRLRAFGNLLVRATVAIVVLLFLLGLLRGLPATDMLLTAIGLAVAAVPEGLPAVVTVALALGVTRMARRRALIRHLPAVETLGCADVICTDKTGTLTVGEMTARALWAGGEAFEVTGEGYAPEGEVRRAGAEALREPPEPLARLLDVLVGCNDAWLVRDGDAWRAIGDPTEAAMLAAGAKLGLRREDLERDRARVRAWPFESDRKRMAVARPDAQGGLELLVKGAPDVLLERCGAILTTAGVRPLEDGQRTAIADVLAEHARRGLRVLAGAYRALEPAELGGSSDDVERDLVFAGLVAMADPPRPEARRAVEACRAAGIRVVMITGDHPRTAIAIAHELGIADESGRALTGAELDRLDDRALERDVGDVAVYARVSAAHKLRIVRAWQARGAVVAMTGDGVNDAPAIKGADIGVAMGKTGTEVSKEASDMVITDDDFASIVAAVEEGRGVFDNIRKTLQYLLAGNTAELLLMTACIVVGLPMPLLPIHLLWINLVTDGLPALCLAADPISSDAMRRPPRRKGAGLADRRFLTGMLLTGLLTAGVSLAVYLHGLGTATLEEARARAFATLVFAELLRAFSVRSESEPVWRLGLFTNTRLAVVVALTFALQIALHGVAPLRAFFATAPLGWGQLPWLLAAALLPLAVLEVHKLLAREERHVPSP